MGGRALTAFRYDAPPTLGAFMASDKFVRGLMGPFGSGKSVVCVVELLRRAIAQAPDRAKVRRSRWAIIRNTYRELKDTTRRTFEEWMPGAKNPGNWSEQDFTYTLQMPLADGTSVEAEFLFRALDRPDDVKKLLSLEITGAWVNEAREVPFAVIKALIGRLGRFPSMRDGGPSWHGVFMDTNPPDDDSWWYKLFEEKSADYEELISRIDIFKQPGGRDPKAENLGHWEHGGRCVGFYPTDKVPEGAKWTPHLVESYYQNLAATNASDALWVKVHVDAQYGPTMNGRPVYPEFKDAVHVIAPEMVTSLSADAPLLIGADFGLTPAVVFGQRDPKDGQLQIFDEMVATDLGAVRFFEEVARHAKRKWPRRPISGTGDPAGEQRNQVDERTPYDVASSQGVPLSPAYTNDFTIRRESVGRALTRLTMLGRPALVVSSRCKVLRKAMNGGYCFKRVASAGDERFREVPDKTSFSHVAEALQYLAVGEGEDARALESTTEHRKVRGKFKVITNGTRRPT